MNRNLKSEEAYKSLVLAYHRDRTGITEEEALQRWDGLHQFLELCVEKAGTEQVASEPVDELWHDFLLFTESYRAYCLDNFGKFVQHLPATTTPPSGYFDSRMLLEKKGILSPVIWPLQERAQWSVGYVEN